MVLNTEWAQVEVIDLINDGSGLAFGIIGGRSTGVVVKTIVPGGVADRGLVSHAPVVPTKILGDPVELDKHLIENGFGDLFSAIPPSNTFTTPYIYTGQQTD
ncbi:hypothetical protein AMK59_1441, partial [Oryctes borbonicus]